jgi:hypothetical protein
VFEGFVNLVNDATRLFDGGVSPPAAELLKGINLLCSMSGSIRLRSNSSKSSDTMDKRLIGRYEDRSWGGFPGLKMRMICATFHWVWK